MVHESTEGVIRVMPEALANQIAAGEVVQRPASVVKELVENALDAGASEIEVIVKEAGSELIQVVDDGCGMSRADAERCFRRHATSKIRGLEDLEQIQTLGFRGEALASIGAVAQVELKTKRVEDDAGYRVGVEGGKQVAAAPCAAPDGTSVAVRNLFYNVPARRNFLKTPATEFKHISETFQQLALSNPAVAFRLVHNGNEIYRLPLATEGDFLRRLRRRVLDLLGTHREDDMLPVRDQSSYLAVRGWIGTPALRKRSPTDQFLFVNGRHVTSRYLAHGVRKAYGDMLPDGTFPFFALFLDLDPRRVDVNVHPGKEEVKFEDQSGIYAFLRSAVREALSSEDLVPQFDARAGEQDGASPRPLSLSADESGSAPARPSPPQSGTTAGSPGEHARLLYDTAKSDDDTKSRRMKDAPVWQLDCRYVVTVNERGLLVIDQEAAHRRVLYEEVLGRLERRDGPSQQLLFPETRDLSPAQFSRMEEMQDELRAVGFELEPFGGQTVVVRGVPTWFAEDDAGTLLEGLLDQLDEHDGSQQERVQALARRLASQAAIRSGQSLDPEEMQALVDALLGCEMPYSAPTGQPTMLRLTADALEEQFNG